MFPSCSAIGGGGDGHGEIVGFRGFLLGDDFYTFAEWLAYILEDLTRMFTFESYPLALQAPPREIGQDGSQGNLMEDHLPKFEKLI